MNDVTQIIESIQSGNEQASEQLLPLVYDELRRLASARMNEERVDHTLTPTALVHEAYIKLVKHAKKNSDDWSGRRHFFNAAAEAMRRILVDHARKKKAAKRGGGGTQLEFDENAWFDPNKSSELLALDESLERLERASEQAAAVVKLRFFAGMTNKQAAEYLQLSPRKTDMVWAFARSWLKREMSKSQ